MIDAAHLNNGSQSPTASDGAQVAPLRADGASAAAPMIEFRDLRREFGSTVAVDNISFSVRRGQVFGYIGPNGAGKTTSMRILATLDQPTSGDALVDGFSVLDDPERVRERIGFMPDTYGVYPNVNVREYLDFFARSYGMRGADRHRAMDFVLGFTQLDALADKPTTGLSKGMRQRLCLGRALIHDPEVLILDEPAAGLDPRARIQLREMIRRLASLGKTVLISSHILTELAEMCDSIGIIEQGRLLEVGSVSSIEQGLQQQRVTFARVLGDPAAAISWIETHASLTLIETKGSLLEFGHDGGEAEDADLLAAMLAAGLRVTAFGSRGTTLEELFMKVTEGRVQ